MMVVHAAAKERHAIAECFAGMTSGFSRPGDLLVAGPGCIPEEEYGTGFCRFIPEDYHGKGKIRSKWLAFLYYRKMWKVMRAMGVHRLFLFSEGEWSYLFLCLALPLRKIKFYLYVHDPKAHTGEQFLVRLVHSVTKRLIGKRALKIFVSYQAAVDELKEHAPYLADKNVLSIPLPGMRSMEFPDILDGAGSWLDEHPYDFLFFGRLEEYKGLDVLMEAMEELSRRGLAPSLLIVGGKGKLVNEVRQMVAHMPSITMISRFVSNRELAESIASSRIVVLPYRDATGTQTVQIANYYRRPVIANRIGAFPEYVEDQVNGLLMASLSAVALADCMQRLLEDAALQEKLVCGLQGAYEQRFSVEAFSRRLEREMAETQA